MNFLDIILIIILGLSFIHGFRKGFVLELATLVALILGVWAGFYFADFMARWLEGIFNYHGKYINIISFIVIFVGVIILVQLLARIIERALKLIALGFLNKLAGAVFSVAKTLFILSILIYFLNRIDDQHRIIKDESRKQSTLFAFTESIAPALIPKMKQYTDLIPSLPQAEPSPSDEPEE